MDKKMFKNDTNILTHPKQFQQAIIAGAALLKLICNIFPEQKKIDQHEQHDQNSLQSDAVMILTLLRA